MYRLPTFSSASVCTACALASGSRFAVSLLEAWKVDFSERTTFVIAGLAPALWRPISIACVVGFAVGVSDLSSYLLVLPPGVTTIAMRIFDLLHYAVRYREAGPILLITIFGFALSFWGTRRFVL